MPRFRFTVRRMMVAVAIAAVAIAVPVERRRRFLRLSDYHHSMAWRGTVPWRDAAGREIGRRHVASRPSWRWHLMLSNKYSGAADRPWLPVPPDPPEPE